MKGVYRYKTYDGQLHETERDAKKYLDRRYGEVMSQIAHALCREAKWHYVKLQEVIDRQLDVFIHLKQIKDDMKLTNPELGQEDDE